MLQELVPVVIVGIVFSFVSFAVYLKYKTTQLELGFDKDSAAVQQENSKLKAQVNDLEERVRVVESIVTDAKVRLGNEISSLG
ncbi:MAG: hypothetical protein AB8B95_04760 [Pseudohongiellaceae bacterium]